LRTTLGLAFIAAVVGLIWEVGRPRAATSGATAAARSVTIDAGPTPEVATGDAATSRSQIRPERDTEAADDEGEAIEEPDVPRIAIDGHVIVVDRQGIEHTEESGTLVPRYDGAPDADGSFTTSNGDPVAVVRGRFHVEVPEGGALDASYFVLGGRVAEHTGIPVSVVAGETITLRAAWIPSKRLHVRDRATNAELDDVIVLSTEDDGRGAIDVSGPDAKRTVLAEHVTSPLVLAPPIIEGELSTQKDLWFRAPGHAWTRFCVQFEWEREDTVLLAPATALVVDLAGTLPADGARLRIRNDPDARIAEHAPEQCLAIPTSQDEPSDAEPDPEADDVGTLLPEMFQAAFGRRGPALADVPARLGAIRFDDLDPGTFVVSVEIGDATEDPLVLAEAKVQTQSDAAARVSLAIAADTRPPRVLLAGTLFVPAGWIEPEALKSADALVIRIEPMDLTGRTSDDDQQIRLGEMTALPGRPGWYHWSAQDVRPATWRFTIDKLMFTRALQIGSEGRSDVDLVPSEPATVHVRVVDATSGAPVRIWRLFWVAADAPMSPLEFEREDNGPGLVAQVPAGSGHFALVDGPASLESWTLEDATAIARLCGGDQQLTVRVHESTSLMVRFRCHGDIEPRFDGVEDAVKLHAIAHRGQVRSTRVSDDGICIVVNSPGRYRVTVADLPGYQPIGPFEVDLSADTITERVVELRMRGR
jgi:hypothetical protein